MASSSQLRLVAKGRVQKSKAGRYERWAVERRERRKGGTQARALAFTCLAELRSLPS